MDFVTRREAVEDSKPGSLWRFERISSGPPKYRPSALPPLSQTRLNYETRYKNIITGSLSPKPVDMQGGILADGMGLGKTLTMIASIVASLHRAEEHGKARPLWRKEANASVTPVKSTLVILPSICRYRP